MPPKSTFAQLASFLAIPFGLYLFANVVAYLGSDGSDSASISSASSVDAPDPSPSFVPPTYLPPQPAAPPLYSEVGPYVYASQTPEPEKKKQIECVCWRPSLVAHAPGKCPVCGGDGYTNGDYGDWEPRSRENECRHCSGTGICPACKGECYKYY